MAIRIAITLQSVLGIGIAIVWIKSAGAHLANPYFFISSIYKYKLVNPDVGRYVGMILPTIQLVLGLCLLSRIFFGGALLGSAGLLTLLAAVQAIALARGLKIDCGCFGPSASRPIGQGSLTLVVVLAICAYIALACCLYQSRRDASRNVSEEALS